MSEGVSLSPEQYNSLMYIAGQLAQTKGIKKKEKLIGNWLRDQDDQARVLLVEKIVDSSVENTSFARIFLVLLNWQAMKNEMGKPALDSLVARCKREERYSRLARLFDELAKVKSNSVNLVRTKTAMMLQILILLADRLQEAGLPQCRLDAVDCVINAVERDVDKKEMHISLEKFGSNTWGCLREELEEADFQKVTETEYRLTISDAMIQQYAEGGSLQSGVKEGSSEMADRLSEGMIRRMGMNIVKRFALMFRMISMYPPDHPGVAPMMDTIVSTLEANLMEKEHITLTIMGGKLLVDEIPIKKTTKALTDFLEAMDERNLTSVTFHRGVNLEEVKQFCLVFSLTEKQIRERGGVKGILEKKGVSHIVVDQFKYGVISYDAEDQKLDSITADEKQLENIIYSEVLRKLKEGDDESIHDGELGAAFHKMIKGDGKSSIRKTLARIVVAFDPGLLDKAIFEEEGLRDQLSWSAARKMVDELIETMEQNPTAHERQYAIETLGKMMDVAIARNKDTTLRTVIDKLSVRFTRGETNVDVAVTIMEVLSSVAKKLVIQFRYPDALKIIDLFRKILVKTKYGTPLAENLDERIKVLQGLCVTALSNFAADEEFVEAVCNGLAQDSKETIEACQKILEDLNSEQVVEKLLELFLDDNRTVRNRTYNLLLRLKDITVPALRFKLQSLGDANVFPRNAEDGPLTDEAWYIMRNIIDLMAELDAFETLDTLEKIVADPDPRVRRECIAALAKHHNRHTHEIALRLIEDPNEEVREKAILALGSPHSREATPKLIDLFFAHPVHRQTILLSLSKIGGDEVRDFLVNAVRPQSAAMKRIFSGDIQIQAIKALGRIGDGDTEQKLRSFVRFHQNPFIRIYRLARRRHKRGRELLHAATQSLAQMEQRSRMNAAQSSEPPRVAAIR